MSDNWNFRYRKTFYPLVFSISAFFGVSTFVVAIGFGEVEEIRNISLLISLFGFGGLCLITGLLFDKDYHQTNYSTFKVWAKRRYGLDINYDDFKLLAHGESVCMENNKIILSEGPISVFSIQSTKLVAES